MSRLTIYAGLHLCPNCRALTITALDDFNAALEVRLDPIPLTVDTEILALLQRKATYDLVRRSSDRHIIIWRDTFRIEDRQHTVLATHQCPGPIPANTIPKDNEHRKAANEQCPF